MPLPDVMEKFGYAFRQHLEEEGWGARKLTVIDLENSQREALEQRGLPGLKEVLQQQNTWTFPAFDIEKPLPRRRDLTLAQQKKAVASVIASTTDDAARRLAEQLVDAVEKQFGVRLPIVDDRRATNELLAEQELIVVGGAHENSLALSLALRHQILFVDASVPGEDGWVVTTHNGLHPSGHSFAQLSGAASAHAAMIQCFLDAVTENAGDLIARHTHRIEPGTAMREHLPSWEDYAASLPARLPQLRDQNVKGPADPHALAEILGQGLDSGGFEINHMNAMPIDMAVECARYYQLSADPRALQLFRELLLQLSDYYLKTPEGASYPSDLDFRLGHLIRSYARLEHESIFDDDDRLFFANFLLSCTRSIYEYAMKQWPVKDDATTRHNHETFPGRSLLYAADYFGRYGIADVDNWLKYTERVFHGPPHLWQRSKQKENSKSYEPFVFEHACCYSGFTNRGLSLFADGCLRQIIDRQRIATDNFLRPVDYGDTHIDIDPTTPALARLLAAEDSDPAVQWFAAEDFHRKPRFLASFIRDIPGLRTGKGAEPKAEGWELAPLDPIFASEYADGFPQDYAFDKLALRTGWEKDDHYLLLEGVGNNSISHSHLELNGIVRLNHLGRHWLVSNGYGRRTGLTNVLQSYKSRVRGPEDHNMLVLQRDGEFVRDFPPCSAMLQRGGQDGLHYATSAVLNYGGVDWFRTLIVSGGAYVLVIDRVHITESGLDAAHVEWNALGQAKAQGDGFRLEQQGVFMDITSASPWSREQSAADQSASWKTVLDSGDYPYADFPLTKLVFHAPSVGAGETHMLATLLAASDGPAKYTIAQPDAQRITVEGAHGQHAITLDDADLSIRADGSACEVHFDALPALPEPLRALSQSV